MKIRLVEEYVLNENGETVPYYKIQIENEENNWEILKIAQDTVRRLDKTPASESVMISLLTSIEGRDRNHVENAYLLLQSESSRFDDNIILPLLNHKDDDDVEIEGYYTIVTDPHDMKIFIAEPTLEKLKDRIEQNKHNIERANELKDKVTVVDEFNIN